MPGKKWRTGKIQSVPCPWEDCGKRNNFTGHKEMLLDQWSLEGAAGDNPWFSCDHCGRGVEVVKVERAILVSLRQTTKESKLEMPEPG